MAQGQGKALAGRAFGLKIEVFDALLRLIEHGKALKFIIIMESASDLDASWPDLDFDHHGRPAAVNNHNNHGHDNNQNKEIIGARAEKNQLPVAEAEKREEKAGKNENTGGNIPVAAAFRDPVFRHGPL